MNLNKSTRYALCAAIEMARLEGASTITVGEVAARYEISEGALAKVFQQLVRSGIAIGLRGVGGGYRLEREPSSLSVLDIIDLFEPHRPVSPAPGGDDTGAPAPDLHLRRLFEEVDDLARNTFAATTLETLAR